jgi:hypothetical protein
VEWYEGVEKLEPRIVRIRTPGGSGSGFILPWQSKADLVAVATAAHVVDHAHYWEQPIRIDQVAATRSVLLRDDSRAILLDESRDSAVIIFQRKDLISPASDLEFIPDTYHVKVGNEVGWLGFPAIASSLCFFSGRISAWNESDKSYLVDAVAVNGVSGGLVFYLRNTTGVTAVGVVSAYIPNRTTGESLPGLAVARDVSYLHEKAKEFDSMSDALAAQAAPELPPPVPDTDSKVAG